MYELQNKLIIGPAMLYTYSTEWVLLLSLSLSLCANAECVLRFDADKQKQS